VTIAPLLPIEDPESFFGRLSTVSDAIVIDHFIGGDGSLQGRRTLRTRLPEAMRAVRPESCSQDYLFKVLDWARKHYQGQIGIGRDGFAARYTEP